MNKINFIYTIRHSQHSYINGHQHNCHELVYYAQGRGVTEIGSATYAFRPNTFALIPPHVLHDERHAGIDAEMICIGYQCSQPALKTMSGVFADGQEGAIRGCIMRMVEEFARQQEGYSQMLDLILGELFILLQRLLNEKSLPGLSGEPLQYVKNYMDEHFRQRITIERLADMSGYSYDRFRHLFKARAGVAPMRYLLLKRLEYAQSLLRGTDMPVGQIAAEAGFVNDAQFCSLFKREFGMTPRGYKSSGA